jgi:hypothetical protein
MTPTLEANAMHDLHPLNRLVRKIIAWPFCLAGLVIVHIGGGLLLFSAWVLEVDVSEVLKN